MKKISIRGTTKRPRISVFRSNKFLYIQLIDDEKQKTLLGISEKQFVDKTSKSNTEVGQKVKQAKNLGILFAKQAHDKKITHVVFDRGRYAYLGKIKAVAEGLREGGLIF